MNGDCDANLKGIVGLFLPRRLSSNQRTSRILGRVLCLVPTGISILYLALERRINQSVLVELLLCVGFSASHGVLGQPEWTHRVPSQRVDNVCQALAGVS